MTIWRHNTVLLWVPFWIESCPPKDEWKSWPLVPVNVTLFQNRIFADINKLRWGHWDGSSFHMTCVFIRRGKHHVWTETPSECYVLTEAEIELMQLPAKEGQRSTANTSSSKQAKENHTQSLRENTILLALWFRTSSLQNQERIHFYCFSHLVCGTLLQKVERPLGLWCFVMALGN